jgi:hypothetical protein
MPDTAFHFPDAARAARLASMHARRDGKLEVTPRELSSVYFSGAGGLASTAEDYLQFAQMLLNGGELNGRRYLGPRTVELMRSNHTGDMVNGQFGRPARGMGFGLGMQVVEDPVAAELAVSKGGYGWAGGTGVSFWIEPEEDMVAIFFIQGGAAGVARPAFEAAVRQAIIDRADRRALVEHAPTERELRVELVVVERDVVFPLVVEADARIGAELPQVTDIECAHVGAGHRVVGEMVPPPVDVVVTGQLKIEERRSAPRFDAGLERRRELGLEPQQGRRHSAVDVFRANAEPAE